jgi:thiosulfate reductase cytochrome b subunit
VTYTMVLNVLLPLQVVSGLLILTAPFWPDTLARLGGLAVLASIHSLGAWLFCAFLILHLYLITTGPTPTAHLLSMVTGWDTPDPRTPSPEVSRK